MDLQFFAEKDIKKQESGSLRHAIMRYERLINDHQDKINHPEEYISNWDEYTEQLKNGLIKHWNKKSLNHFSYGIWGSGPPQPGLSQRA